MNKKLLFLLVLLLTAATGAWATDYTTLAVGDVIKVGDTFSTTAEGAFNNDFGFHSGETFTLMRADIDNDYNVTEKTDGAYYVFKHVSDFSPYMHFGKAFAVTAISDGLEVTNIETGKEKGNLTYTLAVHEPAAASGYTVSLKDGTQDAGKWTVKAGTDGSFQSLPLKGVKAGTKMKLKYDGDRSMLKGVTAVKAEKAEKKAATVTTAPTGAEIVGVGKTTALVSGGVADGGTLMYAVTTTNTMPTSTDGFSATVPTAQTITASGKVYVWYFVKADDTHTDSEIAATAIEVPVADIVWDVTNVSDLNVQGTEIWYEKEGITLCGNAEMMMAMWFNYGDPTHDGIGINANESGGFTFVAPDGKAFTKIEMKALGDGGWHNANLGTGWAFNVDMEKQIFTVTWTGSAASTVDLLTDADMFGGETISYIAFTLVDAE